MREQSKISIIIIISVIIVILFASYRDYKGDVRLNNFITEFGNKIISKYEDSMGDDISSGLFDSIENNGLTTVKPYFIKSLLDVVTVDNLLIGILLGWLIFTIILKKRKPELVEENNSDQLKFKTLKLSLIWFNVCNILLCITMFTLRLQLSYFARSFYGINYYVVITFCLVNIILNIISILVFNWEGIVFWYISILAFLQIFLIKIYSIIAIYKESGIDSITFYFTELSAIVVILIFLYYCIHYVKKWLTPEQKKNIINICGFIICGILLLMFLEVF